MMPDDPALGPRGPGAARQPAPAPGQTPQGQPPQASARDQPTHRSPHQPPNQPPRPPRRKGRGFALWLLGLGMVASMVALVVAFELTAVAATPKAVTFEVEPGWGAKRVATSLKEHGIIRSAPVFTLYLRWRGIERSIGEGLYDLSPSMDAAEVASALEAGGRPRTVKVVIPEGWRAVEIAARLEAAGLGSAATFRARFTDPGSLRTPDVPAGDGLEGYLFPASYDFVQSGTPDDVVRTMLARFEDELDPPTREALRVRGLSVHDWVTLASMVQAEAANAGEMPVIAGVFLNRLDLGMPLQSDPTVAYGLGKSLPELDAVAGDLRVDTPWNTYTRAGLPKGPIGNPGDDALRSVLEPVRRTDEGKLYLYFLHGNDGGTPVFRPNTTLNDHDRDVQRYLRGPAR